MNDPEFQDELLCRLDVLISLQLERPIAEAETSVSAKIEKLLALGLKPSQVARILGKPANYVSAVLATKRRRARG